MIVSVNSEICKLSNRLRLNLISFGHALVDTDWKGEVLSPVYSRLYYIASGEAEIILPNSEKIMLLSGKWYLIPSGCSFKYDCQKQMEHYFFHLKLCDYDETDLLTKAQVPLSLSKNYDICDFLKNCISDKNILSGLFLKQTAFSFLLDFIKEYNIDIRSDNYSPCVMSAIKYIKENLSASLTISEISKNIFVSKSTLTKHFKKELGVSVNDYILGLVMSKAEYLLSATSESIQTISEKLGFCDQFYFSRRFKEKFGQTPRKYRKYKLQ